MPDLPARLTIPSAWKGAELATVPEEWSSTLSDQEIEELSAAVTKFVVKNGDLARITAKSFPLPTLDLKLNGIRQALLHGVGFSVVRGLPADGLADDEITAMFAGIGAHIGSHRPQNAAGDLIGHVRNTGADSGNPHTRIYETCERQTFHTDSADVVGLLCLRQAREGGESLVVSAATIYNEILAQRPDLLPYLFEGIATDRRGETPPGARPFFTIPVFSWYAGFLTVMYQRQYIDSAQRFDDVPRLTPEHIDALDLFDKLANDSRLHIKMKLRRGDMQFVHNHSLLHDRTAFIDRP
ncbi:MAG: TauD/TfdA family dioxygenase, partial [Acidobacteriota bacterium]|nr:TauD/TfdA family dioxygenase [Acidobacteriota bacterium]